MSHEREPGAVVQAGPGGRRGKPRARAGLETRTCVRPRPRLVSDDVCLRGYKWLCACVRASPLFFRRNPAGANSKLARGAPLPKAEFVRLDAPISNNKCESSTKNSSNKAQIFTEMGWN